MFPTFYTVHLERHGTDKDVGDRMSGENVRLFILSLDHSLENKTDKNASTILHYTTVTRWKDCLCYLVIIFTHWSVNILE